jgi:hypothetical protein
MDITLEAMIVPISSPYIPINKLAATVVQIVFEILFITRSVLMTLSFILRSLSTICAFTLPSALSFCILPGEDATTAVSIADNIAEKKSKHRIRRIANIAINN